MHEEPKKAAEAGAPEPAAPASGQPEQPAPPQDEPAAGSDAAPAVDAERVRLEAEAAQMKDRMLRALAEVENLRRRSERDVKDASLYAITAFARDMLSVADNLRRALEAVPAESQGEGSAIATLVEGVGLTERELLKALEKHGVRKVEAQGRKFDPNVHQAIFEVADPSAPHGTVVQVMQDGFTIGERVLRPAMVAVAKGGPKAPPAEAASEEKPASTESENA